MRAPWPDEPPPGPFRPGAWRSPLRGPWLTALLGSLLLAALVVVAVTGFLSHSAYQPALGMNAIHPIEPGAMDIFALKRDYGGRLTLCGNFDINILALGTPEATREEVRRKMAALAPGGGYVAASSTSIPSYVKPENFRAMVEAIQAYGGAARS